MTKVGILMGSDSDLHIMSQAAEVLENLGVKYPFCCLNFSLNFC